MPSSYRIAIVHSGLDDFAGDIVSGVRCVSKTILRSESFLEFTDSIVTDLDASVLVVYLGSKTGRTDARVGELLRQALDEGLPILPIVRDSEAGGIHEKIPSVIALLNAVDWTSNRAVALTSILRILGLVEEECKVFLSYVRRESTPIALQLHRALVETQFDVFLDRFAVPPGANFQKQLDEDLGDKAFVVLLESSELRSSQWVQHEIAYAHSHRISVLALTLPGVPERELVPTIDDAFRFRLYDEDVVRPHGKLKATSLKKIVDRIEMAHAGALRRRREQLLGSLIDSLQHDGCQCHPVDDWTVLSTADDRVATVFHVTPRRPQPEDLRVLDRVSRGMSKGIEGDGTFCATVAHDVEHMPDQHRRLLTWISEPRQLGVKRLRECKLEVSA